MIGGLKCTHEKLSGRQKLKTDDHVARIVPDVAPQRPVAARGPR